MRLLGFLVFLISAGAGAAQKTADSPQLTEASLLKEYPRRPLLNEIIAFKPVAGHKFNLEAKNDCGNGRRISTGEHLIECQMFAPGTSTLQLYICDEKKTYCRREEFKLITEQPHGLFEWIKYYKHSLGNSGSWEAPYRSGISTNLPARGFANNELWAPLEKAKRDNRKVLVYFSRLDCDSCRLLNELVFASDEFQEATKDYIRVQIDVTVDTEASRIKDLNIVRTPTVVVFNKNFQEIDRRSFLTSPSVFKTWLSKISDKPIADLKNKKAEALNDEERRRLSYWSYYYFPGDPRPAREYAKAIQKPGDDDVLWQDLLQDNPSTNAVAMFKRDFNRAEHSNSSLVRDEYWSAVTRIIRPLANENNTAGFKLAASLLANHEEKVSEEKDVLRRALDLKEVYAALEYGYDSAGQHPEAAKMQTKLFSVLNTMPRLPGVGATPFLNYLKAAEIGDEMSKKQALQQIKNQNGADYGLDYQAAKEAFHNKRYADAMVSTEKVLSVAKDGGWQQGFLLKLDILEKTQRQKEAAQLIDGLLAQLRLPTSTAFGVHKFVQILRDRRATYKSETTPPQAS